jgi:hypothetical protein
LGVGSNKAAEQQAANEGDGSTEPQAFIIASR